MGLHFSKYQANGNDFILIDHRDSSWNPSRSEISRLCHRRYGIGADGLILLTRVDGYDFGMKNYNSDGGECTMCGNGGRSILRFASDLEISSGESRFLAIDGEHSGRVIGQTVSIRMQSVAGISETPAGYVLDTGSPHLVIQVSGLIDYDVVGEGRKIRNSAQFMPNGINVNFYERKEDRIFLRTYERGVEDETLSCGTGAIATAIVTGSNLVHCLGGELRVEYRKSAPDRIDDIWFSGKVEKTFEGML
jgi:diaminopimelate epimerase